MKPDRSHGVDWLQSMLSFMAEEARESRPGGETVITRLADILVIQAVRSWIEQDPQMQTGWLGAFHDRRLGRAIALIHRDPAQALTVVGLAREAAMSRSAFAARFSEVVGESPMRYLARWRMHVALSRLREPQPIRLAELAGTLGYQLEAAFHRAFKRFVGTPPGSVRRSIAPIGVGVLPAAGSA